MKRTTLWIVLSIAAGLLLGYLVFAPGTTEADTLHEHSEGGAETSLWTCSMHPQILQPEAGKCPICGMDLIPAGSGQDGLAPGQFRLTENALALADIRTTRVGAGSGQTQAIRLSGTLRANEKTIATQSAYFDGRIERLLVNYEGETVRMGQLLATLYAPELVAAQQELLTAATFKDAQPALYEAVRKKLTLWKLSEAQIAEIESSGKVQEYFPIYSNVSGNVSEIMVAAGDYVNKGTPLFRIADLGTVWADFDAYENQLDRIGEKQTLTIRAKALPDAQFSGVISFISPVLNPATRTATVRAVLRNPAGRLKPGMFVYGELTSGQAAKSGSLVLPESAVLWTGERSVVYLKPDPMHPVFEMREVSLGPAVEGGYLVLSGLQGGEEVVTQGAFTLDAAAQLQGGKSMMNPGGGKSATGHEAHLGLPAENGQGTRTGPDSAAFEGLVSLYLGLKDALVASDTEKARAVAGTAISYIDDHPDGNLQPALRERLRDLSRATDLPNQREAFRQVSEILIGSGEGMEHHGRTLYVQFCPMANDNKGAYWLSAQAEIRNPYFGDAMLTCGENRATWAAN